MFTIIWTPDKKYMRCCAFAAYVFVRASQITPKRFELEPSNLHQKVDRFSRYSVLWFPINVIIIINNSRYNNPLLISWAYVCLLRYDLIRLLSWPAGTWRMACWRRINSPELDSVTTGLTDSERRFNSVSIWRIRYDINTTCLVYSKQFTFICNLDNFNSLIFISNFIIV